MSRMSIVVKGTVIATVVALAFSSVAFAKGRAPKAPAAAATSSQESVQVIQSSWKSELAWLNFDSTVLGRIDKVLIGVASRFDKDLRSKRPDERISSKFVVTLKDVQMLLAKAEAIATTHAGFDANGKVTDQAQALKSVQSLGADLAQLRGTLIYRLEHIV